MENVKTAQIGGQYQENALCCPKCGGENLHQVKVESIFRQKNDGVAVIHTSDNVDIRNREWKNIHVDSDVLYIYFTCEGCNWEENKPPYVLRIAQHKGTTYVDWVNNAN